MALHDHSYKHLFSHPQMVRDLLEGFVREDWLEQLDYTSLEKVNASYVSDDLRERADDLVWRVRWGENWIYVYLLLEFQSTVERYMAVRIHTYVGLLYQDLIKGRQLPADGLLPPVFPIVLYNGSVRWNAAHELGALIQAGPQALDRYRPQTRYLLIDERKYRNSDLAPLRNLVAALFRLENSRTSAEVGAILSSLVEWLRSPEQTSLRRAFSVWLGRVIIPRRRAGVPVPEVCEIEEMPTVLAETIERWKAEFRQEGLQEGRQEGLREGQLLGARILLRQLQKCFGELPGWVLARVEQATPEQVERWGERLFDVRNLDELFNCEVNAAQDVG